MKCITKILSTLTIITTLLGLLTTPLAVQAAPSEVEAQAITHKLGEDRLSVMIFDVYDAALYNEDTSWSYDDKFALCLTYLRDFSAKDLADRSLEEVKPLNLLPKADHQAFRDRLLALFPDVKEKDRICAINLPETSEMALYHNGKLRGNIEQSGWVKPFFAIWLDPKTSEPEMRKKLLGL